MSLSGLWSPPKHSYVRRLSEQFYRLFGFYDAKLNVVSMNQQKVHSNYAFVNSQCGKF